MYKLMLVDTHQFINICMNLSCDTSLANDINIRTAELLQDETNLINYAKQLTIT